MTPSFVVPYRPTSTLKQRHGNGSAGARLAGVHPVRRFGGRRRGVPSSGRRMYAELLDRLAGRHRGRVGRRRGSCADTSTIPGRRRWHCGCSAACTGWCSSGGPVRSAAYYPSVGGTGSRTRVPPRSLPCSTASRSGPRMARPAAPDQRGGSRAALMGGLLHLPDDAPGSLRLFEIGSSGGPEPAGRPVRVRRRQRPAVRSEALISPAASRRGRQNRLIPWPDLGSPRPSVATQSPSTSPPPGRLALTAYVWPDQRTPARAPPRRPGHRPGPPPDVRRPGPRTSSSGST